MYRDQFCGGARLDDVGDADVCFSRFCQTLAASNVIAADGLAFAATGLWVFSRFIATLVCVELVQSALREAKIIPQNFLMLNTRS